MDKVYVGTENGGFAISKDGGETWTSRDPIPGQKIWSIFAAGNNVYVGTRKGIAVSKNGGRIWAVQDLKNGSQSDRSVYSIFGINNRVWIHIREVKGLGVSEDNGQTWSINSELPNSSFFNSENTSMYHNGKRLFVGSEDGLAITDDDGKTWKFLNKSNGLGVDYVRAITGFGTNVYVGLERDGGAMSISEDDGETWGLQETTPAKEYVKSVAVGQGKVYVATKGGLAISDDVWEKWVVKSKADGLTTDNITSVSAVGSNVYVGTKNDGLYVSRDAGQTWEKKKPGKDGEITVVFAQSD